MAAVQPEPWLRALITNQTPFFTLHSFFALFSNAISNKQYVDSKGKMIHDV
jgi:hypothetical protein